MSVSAPSSVTNTSPCYEGLLCLGRYSNMDQVSTLTLKFDKDKREANEEETIPFSSDDTTPP